MNQSVRVCLKDRHNLPTLQISTDYLRTEMSMLQSIPSKQVLAILFVLAASGCGPKSFRADTLNGSESLGSPAGSNFNLVEQEATSYLIGAGIGDVTGPTLGLATMGYAAPAQETSGLHTRLWARAFAIAEKDQPDQRLVYVVSDICFISGVIKSGVIEKLQELYGDRYTHSNVMLTATHNHSGPGAYAGHHMYNMPAKGFSQENFAAIVKGIVDAIRQADNNMEPGNIRFAEGILNGYSRNRSLAAYNLNAESERASYGSATDQEVTLLRFDGESGTPIGLAHWYAVHATSVDKYNSLISSDNKGYAAWLFEKEMGRSYLQSKGFVAAFANSNAGDASPNVAGDIDGDGDWECAAGENFACARWSGEGHYKSASQLYASAGQNVHGRLQSVHRFVDFSNISLTPDNSGVSAPVDTCISAIGLSMVAGSEEDGPGVGREGNNCSTGGPLAQIRCRPERFSCQGEKPVTLNTGSMGSPTWTPNVLPTQIFLIGNVALVGVPAEFTTMSGRRLRNHLKETLARAGVSRIVIAGYANEYSNYVATEEEYQAQHYEGASTLFGEWTLMAYKLTYSQLAASFLGTDAPAGEPAPEFVFPDTRNEPAPGIDRAPLRGRLGAVLTQAKPGYARGQTVSVTYQGANLKLSQQKERSIIEVQKRSGSDWHTVAYDWDFATRIYWQGQRLGTSTVKVDWDIPADMLPGDYRIVYHGWANIARRGLESFDGISSIFSVR